MVPGLARPSEVIEYLPEAVGGIFKGEPLKSFYQLFIVSFTAVVELRAWKTSQFAGPAHRNALITYQFFY
jgi:hypothetical protein